MQTNVYRVAFSNTPVKSPDGYLKLPERLIPSAGEKLLHILTFVLELRQCVFLNGEAVKVDIVGAVPEASTFKRPSALTEFIQRIECYVMRRYANSTPKLIPFPRIPP